MDYTSIWEKESFYKNCDILIVGSGLMGLWTAFELKKKAPKLSITIIEKNTIPFGASTRNAGFACFGSPTELLHDATTMGENEMWQIAEMRYLGIEKIKKNFNANLIEYNACGGYECLLIKDAHVLDKLAFLNKGLQRITGNNDCFSIQNSLLQEFSLSGFNYLIQNKLEGTLHSGKLVQSLTQQVLQAGVQILYATNIVNWKQLNNKVEVSTNNTTFQTNQLIFCTNAFTKELLNHEKITPARGQILVTSVIENLALNGSFHFDEGYYYFRNLNNRILLGGARNIAFEEEETTQLTTTPTIQHQLEYFLKTHIAQEYSYTIEHRWSGIMGFTQNKKPVFKPIHNNIHYAVACNGMGVALTPVFAEKIVQEILS